MAIRVRHTKAGPMYWVVTRGHWERAGDGRDRREADRLNARRKKEVRAGTFAPKSSAASTVGKYLDGWLSGRTNRSADLETRMLELHVLSREWFRILRLDDLESGHIQKLVNELKETARAPRYVANIYGVLRVALRAAHRHGLLHRDVCVLDPGTLSRKAIRPTEPYTLEEAQKILATATGALRVWLALALYGGMRCGEVNGRRWGDWDAAATPLGCLTLSTQYAGRVLKTDSPRRVPVHPDLAAELVRWCTEYELVTLRKPTPEAFIIPGPDGGVLPRQATYKALRRACERAGVTFRGQHATRHTFLTQARRGGAKRDVLEKITHNAEGEMVDHYTHWEWAPLCEAVMCLPSFVSPPPAGAPLTVGTPAKIVNESSQVAAPTQGLEPWSPRESQRNTEKAAQFTESERSMNPAAGTRSGAELGAIPAAWALAFAAARVLQGVA